MVIKNTALTLRKNSKSSDVVTTFTADLEFIRHSKLWRKFQLLIYLYVPTNLKHIWLVVSLDSLEISSVSRFPSMQVIIRVLWVTSTYLLSFKLCWRKCAVWTDFSALWHLNWHYAWFNDFLLIVLQATLFETQLLQICLNFCQLVGGKLRNRSSNWPHVNSMDQLHHCLKQEINNIL